MVRSTFYFAQNPGGRIASQRVWLFFYCCCFVLLTQVRAQENRDQTNSTTPIYVTVRCFELSAPLEAKVAAPNAQVFRVNSAGRTEDESWLTTLKKAYPGYEPRLLLSNAVRVYRTSKPTIVYLGSTPRANLQLELQGAHGVNEKDQPITHLISEINVNYGSKSTRAPISYGGHPLEVESQKSYFYAVSGVQFSAKDYVDFFRHHQPYQAFAERHYYLALVFSVEMERPAGMARFLSEPDSKSLLQSATKRVLPERLPELKAAGITGDIQVRMEINAQGKVAKAYVINSSIPEMNQATVVAARQWEFPTTAFEENKTPVNVLVKFLLGANEVKVQ